MSPKLNLWVDVGGTFTDAILWLGPASGKETNFQSRKVLSSGKTRCSVTGIAGTHRLIVNGLPPGCPDFWSSARISLSVTDHTSIVGNIVASGDQWVELDLPLPPNLFIPDTARAYSAEISAGLESPVLAAHQLLDIPLLSPLPPLNIRLGTTRGTNALLTRTGADVGLCITQGFGDIPFIGNQDRPDLFALTVIKSPPLCRCIHEITERVDAHGNILIPLDDAGLRSKFAEWKQLGIRSVAIVLMHSYLMPKHEEAVAKVAAEFDFDEVICSSHLSPVRKLLSRSDTSLVDAYLSPVINDYLQVVKRQFGNPEASRLEIMTSAGSLVDVEEFHGKDSVLSGPAGGIVAVQELLRQTTCQAALAFDMGGTSTDVSRCTREELPLQYDTTKAGIRIVTPILSIHTVAAGGGSICSFDGVQMHVGPASAGSYPGPACYGQGGPLTITDINLLLGIIPEDALPFPVDRQAAEKRLHQVAESIRANQAAPFTDLEIASGFRQIANQVMADAIRVISTRQGADPREHLLVGFGGAAGQHQCDLADALGISEIVDPPLAGLFSAVGIGFAQHRRFATIPLYCKCEELSSTTFEHLSIQARNNLIAELQHIGYSRDQITERIQLEMRYVGTDATLLVPLTSDFGQLASLFHQTHERFFGYSQSNRGIEICTIRAEVIGPSVAGTMETVDRSGSPFASSSKQKVWHQGTWLECPRLERNQLPPGSIIHGPAIIISAGHTTWISADWSAEVDQHLNLRLKRFRNTLDVLNSESTQVNLDNDPVFRDLIGQRLATIALSMGEILEKTAISVNIKERRDFSCAIFDAAGFLIANAPHVPVHLGAMGQTVRELIREFPDLDPNDCLLTNDPNRGGSHLPDITVATPVFDPQTKERIFFVACRAHHAEIGGVTAGSMPPTATTLEEEGVLLPPQFLIRRNESNVNSILEQLVNSKYPSRTPNENIADLAAQQAANQFGVNELIQLVQKYGTTRISNAMNQIMDASELRVQRWIESLAESDYKFCDQLDDGTEIRVQLTKVRDLASNDVKLRVDFTGTSAPHPKNFNANRAIVTAAILYVIRTLAGDDLPLNEGAIRRVELVIPQSLLSPLPPSEAVGKPASLLPAVAAGNVETSQRIVDVLFGALGVAAASQGTMNNFLFGDATFGYYETICGGTGATAQGNGCDAVHSHMTNTRITDPEVLEARYPVRLCEFSIRRESGGAGEFRGGHGIVREIEFLRPLQASLITSRRSGQPPYGLYGGAPGKLGRNTCVRSNGTIELLGSTAQIQLQTGDRIRIESPGGGGFGAQQS